MMPIGIRYNFTYIHKRKEVVTTFQVGTMPPFVIVMGAEAFCQDIDFIGKDRNITNFVVNVKERKDLPIDHDFGASGGEIRFNPLEWEGKMGDDSAKA